MEGCFLRSLGSSLGLGLDSFFVVVEVVGVAVVEVVELVSTLVVRMKVVVVPGWR